MKSLMVCFVLLSEVCFGQLCDSTLKPYYTNAFRYEARTNRCEGFYIATVSSQTLDLVGVTRGVFHYELDINEVIEIQPPADANCVIHVRAQAVQTKMYYRMDTELAPRQRLLWPTREILFPNGLYPGKISVFGWYQDAGGKVYVPIRSAGRLSGIHNDSLFRIVLRSAVDVDYVSYTWKSELANRSENHTMDRPFRSGTAIIVVLPEHLRGRFTLLVQAKIRGSDDFVRNLVTLDLGKL
ncbi:MAG: hypothetical protein NTZ35_04050 [Ignavibacteriales bacterium]|nr:hypothetical protein [Ignavibacteriales bacterium]